MVTYKVLWTGTWGVSFCWVVISAVNCHLTLLTTVSSSLTPAGALFGRRILRHSSLHVPTVHSAIGVLLLPEQGFGTAFQPLCTHSTCPLNVSNGHWRHFCLFETAAHLWLCLRRARYKFSDIHTCIHTYSLLVCCMARLVHWRGEHLS